eukprot:scaffold92623_cov19-Prasinocladus_malaysianus.AAC.1
MMLPAPGRTQATWSAHDPSERCASCIEIRAACQRDRCNVFWVYSHSKALAWSVRARQHMNTANKKTEATKTEHGGRDLSALFDSRIASLSGAEGSSHAIQPCFFRLRRLTDREYLTPRKKLLALGARCSETARVSRGDCHPFSPAVSGRYGYKDLYLTTVLRGLRAGTVLVHAVLSVR